MESLNRMAVELVDEAVDFAEELTIAVQHLAGDAAVLDFGVVVPGGIETGLLLTEIQTAGLATVQTRLGDVADTPVQYVELTTDHPALALLCSQKSGWELEVGEFQGLGSGPARALVAEEEEFQRLAYRDDGDFAVLVVESDELPGDDVAAHVAERAGVPETAVFLPTYSTASITGSVAAAAKAAELATFRLTELGYDPAEILSVSGAAPVAPVASGEETAIARTMDALAYGGEVVMTVEDEFDRFEEVPSSAADEYGQPLGEAFDEVDWEFGELPRSVFAPAQVTIDVLGGDTYALGKTHDDVLAESFGL